MPTVANHAFTQLSATVKKALTWTQYKCLGSGKWLLFFKKEDKLGYPIELFFVAFYLTLETISDDLDFTVGKFSLQLVQKNHSFNVTHKFCDKLKFAKMHEDLPNR